MMLLRRCPARPRRRAPLRARRSRRPPRPARGRQLFARRSETRLTAVGVAGRLPPARSSTVPRQHACTPLTNSCARRSLEGARSARACLCGEHVAVVRCKPTEQSAAVVVSEASTGRCPAHLDTTSTPRRGLARETARLATGTRRPSACSTAFGSASTPAHEDPPATTHPRARASARPATDDSMRCSGGGAAASLRARWKWRSTPRTSRSVTAPHTRAS
jgi:hypothetical protein